MAPTRRTNAIPRATVKARRWTLCGRAPSSNAQVPSRRAPSGARQRSTLRWLDRIPSQIGASCVPKLSTKDEDTASSTQAFHVEKKVSTAGTSHGRSPLTSDRTLSATADMTTLETPNACRTPGASKSTGVDTFRT